MVYIKRREREKVERKLRVPLSFNRDESEATETVRSFSSVILIFGAFDWSSVGASAAVRDAAIFCPGASRPIPIPIKPAINKQHVVIANKQRLECRVLHQAES